VEIEAALSRRAVPSQTWVAWKNLVESIHWVNLTTETYPQLRAFNRALKLRAADAGQLFVMDRLLGVIPELKLVSFDEEMLQAAAVLNLPVHSV
jgi:hypothetical protein